MNAGRAKEQEFSTFEPDLVAELRGEVGNVIKGPPGFLSEATADGIRHFAQGIGDYNRLWLDGSYAQGGPYSRIVGPPSILFAFNKVAWGAAGLRGIHSFFSGVHFEWNKTVGLGDRIESETVLKEVVEMSSSKFARKTYKQVRRATFNDTKGRVVAIAEPYSFRVERDSARQTNKYGHLKPATYEPEEYEDIARVARAESPRGAEPRYWEDVKEGEQLPAIVRGPITVTDIIMYLMGQGGQWLRGYADAMKWYQRHPKGGIRNGWGALEPPEIVHWDDEFAQRVGLPAAYDYGPQRVAWLITAITNWAGDWSFLRDFDAEVRRFNFVGDTTWCTGSVTSKFVRDGQHVVECSVLAHDQRGETTTLGRGTVELPTRGREFRRT